MIDHNIAHAKPELPILIDQLRREHFYGSLELKLEKGEVVLIRKTETIKVNCRDNRGSNGIERPSI